MSSDSGSGSFPGGAWVRIQSRDDARVLAFSLIPELSGSVDVRWAQVKARELLEVATLLTSLSPENGLVSCPGIVETIERYLVRPDTSPGELGAAAMATTHQDLIEEMQAASDYGSFWSTDRSRNLVVQTALAALSTWRQN